MAHIADLLNNRPSIGLNNYIARELSPHPGYDHDETPMAPSEEKQEKQKYTWRLHQAGECRKYQLFPSKEKKDTTRSGRSSPNPEKAHAIAMAWVNDMRAKREPVLNRRRKVSVPELGPMTTVHEVAMDSPTIPGRPPLHERSISAPGNDWRQQPGGDAKMAPLPPPALEEKSRSALPHTPWPDIEDVSATMHRRTPPPSPKHLAPLIIPDIHSKPPQRVLNSQRSNNTLRCELLSPEGTPPEVPPKAPWMMDGRSSPMSRRPFTPMSSVENLTTPGTTTTAGTTPISAPSPIPEGRASPSPWNNNEKASPSGHARRPSDTLKINTQKPLGHRRNESDVSVVDRGRNKKRRDKSPTKETILKRNVSADRRAFETLPQGTRAADAIAKLEQSEIDTLRKQAIGQAERFEILATKDVEALSKELRALDERCDYLRKTHHSLRSGRRNLHERICTYLRSPRTARFSPDAILKQEEALAELDNSIDDWVSKLEQAENRRTRVRQKLLEHVAATLLIPQPNEANSSSGKEEGRQTDAERQMAKNMMGTVGANTPPRSPTKAQSPQRLAEQVPPQSPPRQHQQQPEFVIPRKPLETNKSVEKIAEEKEEAKEQPRPDTPVEEIASGRPESPDTPRPDTPIDKIARGRGGYDIQSIRIYADTDVYALLADVEAEMNLMSDANKVGKDGEALAQATKDMTVKRGAEYDEGETLMAEEGEQLIMLSSMAFDRSATPASGEKQKGNSNSNR